MFFQHRAQLDPLLIRHVRCRPAIHILLATASPFGWRVGTLRVVRNSTWHLRRDSLGAKLRRYATLGRSEGRYVPDLGIRHGVYAAIPSELSSGAVRIGAYI
jgi:hypothetical protein